MITLAREIRTARTQNVKFTNNELVIELEDGRTVSVPLAWYPRLLHGTPQERLGWRLSGKGEGIHWEALDEDSRTEHLLGGTAAGESQRSLQKWLNTRQAQSKTVRRVREKKAKYG